MEQWITEGRVSVNGDTATIGDRVSDEDLIRVDGKPVGKVRHIAHRYLLYNKPEGEVCSRDDPEHKRTVFDRLPGLKGQRWVAVGRLDINSTGLLLFTTDGELANRLMHPAQAVEREYAVRVKGEVTAEILARMREGVLIDGVRCAFSDIQKSPTESDGSNHWYYVVLMQGRNREVRRIWESQGLTVSRLKRVRYGNVFMPSVARVGRHRELQREAVRGLYELAGMPPPTRHDHSDSGVSGRSARGVSAANLRGSKRAPATRKTGQRPPSREPTTLADTSKPPRVVRGAAGDKSGSVDAASQGRSARSKTVGESSERASKGTKVRRTSSPARSGPARGARKPRTRL